MPARDRLWASWSADFGKRVVQQAVVRTCTGSVPGLCRMGRLAARSETRAAMARWGSP